jgi:hypothetical protein
MDEDLVLQNAITKPRGISLTPPQEALGIELVLTAQNAKVSISAELQSEFLREFESEPPEMIARAFRAWRRRSNFMPTISEIYDLLEEEAAARYQEREAERAQQEKIDRDQAEAWWRAHPEAQTQWQDEIQKLEEHLSRRRLDELAAEAPTSPRNRVARMQAKALADLPPKKQPKMLGADAGEAPKVIRKERVHAGA